ncbi:MAG: preprotein translocase subunit YajC [Elusimicrobia bacterium]|nr:preprotein translocase subunit YajC [Elusimicrobiota bacterium]
MTTLISYILYSTFYILVAPLVSWAQQGQPGRPASPAGMFISLFPILVFVAIFYFLLFRPQQQAQKARQKMLTGVKRMDKILTNGGLYGTVVNVRGDILDVKLSDNVKVELNRHYVAKVITSQDGTASQPPAQVNIIK